MERLEYAIYDTAFAGATGHKVWKKMDLKKMFPLLFKEEKIYDASKANELIMAQGLVKTNK